ncbi:MAG: hypothetical protein ACLQVK_14745 [Acidimicrobiales bacterium]
MGRGQARHEGTLTPRNGPAEPEVGTHFGRGRYWKDRRGRPQSRRGPRHEGVRVSLASGEVIAYDRSLLTTGAVPRRLAVPGADLSGVRYLRTVADVPL